MIWPSFEKIANDMSSLRLKFWFEKTKSPKTYKKHLKFAHKTLELITYLHRLDKAG